VSGQPVEHLLVEDLRDEAELRVDEKILTVADGDPRGLLAAMLQRVEAEVGEAGDVFAGSVYAEDPALFAGMIELVFSLEGQIRSLSSPTPEVYPAWSRISARRRHHGFSWSGLTTGPGSRTSAGWTTRVMDTTSRR
jgi:hypothetical protein